MRQDVTIAAALCLGLILQPAVAGEPVDKGSKGPLVEAIISGKPIVDMRYRFEWKEQDGFAEDAYANTLRTRLGYETGEFHGFSILLEFENVTSLGDDHFNSTTNGQIQFPVIADPDATEINRAQITFTGIPETAITAGRQRINIANQRFIGAVDFRQNQQTFDAARITIGAISHLTADYIYIGRVHRIFGDDSPMGEFDSDSHAATLTADWSGFGKLMAYGFLLDLDQAPQLSSSTFGARYENSFVFGRNSDIELGIAAEFATQSDYADNPFDYREYYAHGEANFGVRGFGIKAGYERLGGNGVIGFSTPLATLHKFQGFADVFLTTPADGIQDLYGGASYLWKTAPFGTSVKLFAVYHDFRTAQGSQDLGQEVDAGMTIRLREHWSMQIKGAVFQGGPAGPADRNLVWTSLRFQY